MLDAPDLAGAVEQVGIAIRYGSSLDPSYRELAILATAAALGCDYEWDYHEPIALAEGTPAAAVAACRHERGLEEIGRPWRTIIEATRSIVLEHRLADGLFEETLCLLGRTGMTELVAIAGYYSLLANFLLLDGE